MFIDGRELGGIVDGIGGGRMRVVDGLMGAVEMVGEVKWRG